MKEKSILGGMVFNKVSCYGEIMEKNEGKSDWIL